MMPPDKLQRLLQSLPQELYDIIFDLTFTVDNAVLHVNSSYKPAATLQVSRATRAMIAPEYYARRIICYGEQRLPRFVRSLPDKHIAYMNQVLLSRKPKLRSFMASLERVASKIQRRSKPRDVLRMKWEFQEISFNIKRTDSSEREISYSKSLWSDD